MIAAFLLVFAVAGRLFAAEPAPNPDLEQLLRIKPLIEDAFNNGHFERLAPFLDENFNGSMLLKDVHNRAEFQALWRKIEENFGKRKKFSMKSIKINPDKIDIVGDNATASGTADVTVDTPFGQVSYQASFSSKLHKKNGQWQLGRMESGFSPLDKMSSNLNTIVGDIWTAMRVPDQIKAAQPDFDRGGSLFQFKAE